MSHISFFTLLFISLASCAQKKWDGEAGNNLWSSALNWTGNAVPIATDNVVLDNSIVLNNYNVALPSTSVTVKTITITPSASKTIELSLPPTNNLLPGLTVSGPGYGITLNSGGTFKNASGSNTGTAVRVTDSIRINNGGKYLHNTAGGHSTNVQQLATLSGTEAGIFELDIPSASSTISISGRTFGKFVLRSTAAGGVCNYTAAGTSRVNIRNDLDIGPGVNFNLNCSDTIFVDNDLLQETGTINLGNSTRSVVLSIRQNILQATGGTITETGTGIQTILMNSADLQLMSFRGVISNQVALVKNGAGPVLSKSAVSLPYKLSLKNGRIVTTQGMITLKSGCTIEADSLSASGSIDGPLKKEGLNNQSFLFPVGKTGTKRWVQVKNATGDFTVEYFRSDPKSLSNNTGTGLHHISSVEYWDVSATPGATAELKLSFVHPNSGEITNLSFLRVARLINGTWEDAGNAAVSGTPGSDGWVSSIAASGFSASSKSFALASATGLENPLPLSSIRLRALKNGNSFNLSWIAYGDTKPKKFELQRSYDGRHYQTIYESGIRNVFSCYGESVGSFFRVKALEPGERTIYLSNVCFIPAQHNVMSTFIVINAEGKIVKSFKGSITINKSISMHLSELRPGIYFIKDIAGNNTIKYFKRL
jgi:hypothetical protein